jgi:tetratricopeptide (TPR) repeat protein
VTLPGSAAPLAALLLCLTFIAPVPARADAVDDAAKLYQEGNEGPALDRIESYLVEHPKDPRGRFLKAQLLTEKGDPEQAIAIYTAIIEEYPELAEPYNNLAVIYAQQGRYELARNYLEQAVQAFPEYSVALENLGDVYVKLAEGSYRDAAQYDKSSSGLKTKLAALAQLLPDKPQAPVFRTPLPPKAVPAKKKKGTNPVAAPTPPPAQ